MSVSAPAEQPVATSADHHRVVIIGTGFSGIGAAIKLKEAGVSDFVILERADDVGGVWRDNTYPGCACDVPSHLYSFSFAPNPDWSYSFSPQPEIRSYLRNVAERFDIVRYVRFNHDVESATWDEDAKRWVLATSEGTLTADLVIAATGALSGPSIPDIPGLSSFRGTVFHSARWDHDYDLAGKRVAVIGTGASAIQFVPAIQPTVGKLTLFQRTPPWVMSRNSKPYSPLRRALFRLFPMMRKAERAWIFSTWEARVIPFVVRPKIMKIGQKAAIAHLHKQVADPELRRKLRPNYLLGCKRILLADDYYPALTQDNVEVVTSGIAEIKERSVVTTDGVEHEVDAIIFGTGFEVTDPPIKDRVKGRDGRTLADAWVNGIEAHNGTTISGFPNFFIMTGPNTGLGHTSMILMIEAQITYILDALRQLERRGAAAFDVRPEAQAAYNDALQKRLTKTIWAVGGCNSWYQDQKTGKIPALWPGSTIEFRRRLSRFDTASYRFTT
jgi:cation diffusion facilitator CzcD-associated flavoprotein CzcO